MEKTPHSVPNPSVKVVLRNLLLDLNQLPKDMIEEPKDDVPPPKPFVIKLCFHNEDMEVVKQKYKVLSSSSTSLFKNDWLKNFGFQGGCETRMHFRDKRIKIPRHFPHAVGRSWLKEFIKKYERVDWIMSLPESLRPSKIGVKKKRKNSLDGLYAKLMLKEFVKKAKTRARAIKEEGAEEGPFCAGPRRWDYNKKKFVSIKKGSSNDIMMIKKEHDA